MPNLDKLFEKAEKYLQKGKFQSALETYLEIYKYQPSNEEVLLSLGDLSLKLNRKADALRFDSLLADLYIKRNDAPKAVVTCRKILKVSPQDVNTWTKIADLLEKNRQNSEALKAYREALNLYRAAGANPQAIECLQRIVKLDPENLEAHIELGELAARSRQVDIATPAFLRAALLARQAGQHDQWAELVERAHALDAKDEAASIAAGEVFLKKDRPAETVALLEPIGQSKPDDLAILELLAKAYLRTGDYGKAEPACWKLYQARPESIDLVLELAERFVQAKNNAKALELVSNLKDRLFQQGKKNEFLKIMEKIYQADEDNLEVLEMLTGLYNELNKEDGLRRSLTRLFNLYLAGEHYEKVADVLERILDVDPYGEGHHDRLLSLEGHIDAVWYKSLLSRVEPPSGVRKTADASAGTSGGAEAEKSESLDELIVEGEMYQQYQLRSKLTETLANINRLFPGAEQSNTRLAELYDAAKFAPTPSSVPSAGAPGGSPPTPTTSPRAGGAPSLQSLQDFKKISEITSSIYRESTPQAVMQVAVNEIGHTMNVSRCWGALGAADRPPTLTVEYCSPAAPPSDIAPALKLHATVVRHAVTTPDGCSVEDAMHFPVLGPVTAEIQKLGIKSLLAMPLLDRDESAGLIICEQCDQTRAWTPEETLLLKAIASQVVIAVNNTKLRRLVRSLAGSDEETGLLLRSSYLDCLLSEAQRAKELSAPLSVCLLEPDNPAALMKTLGEASFQRYFQQLSKALQSNLRQNDVAIRYSPCSIAVVLPDTALPQGGLAVDKLRRVISQVKLDGAVPPTFCSAVCDVALGVGFDAVDGVTEVINRLEAALDKARKEGGKRVLLSKFKE